MKAEGPRPALRRLWLARWAQLMTLVAFALAQPTYDVALRNPTFLALHEVRAWDVAALIAVGQLGAPALGAIGLAWLARQHAGLELWGRAGLVAVAAVLTALPPLLRVWPAATGLPVAIALVAGAVFGLSFARWSAVRGYVSALAVAAPVFAGVFLVRLPSAAAPAPGLEQLPTSDESGGGRPSVVLVVFDELPVASLLDRDGAVDAARLPGFARLARTSTWFRNTTTPHPTTRTAIPALTTGRIVDERDTIPTLADHPDNLFTRLAPTHALDVRGSIRALCPPESRASGVSTLARCAALADDLVVLWAHTATPLAWRSGLPAIDDTWIGFRADDARARRDAWRVDLGGRIGTEDRAGQVRAFVEALRTSTARPALHALHVVLPHAPWAYLPSGTLYAAPRKERLPEAALERYLLQLGFVDVLLSELLDAVAANPALCEALLVVTADHGASFVTAVRRRQPTPERLPDIAFVPLFVRFPGQTSGAVDRRPAQTVDVSATILDVVGSAVPDAWDGRSLARPASAAGRDRCLYGESNRAAHALPDQAPERTPLRERIEASFETRAGRFGKKLEHGRVGRPVSGYERGPVRRVDGLELTVAGQGEEQPGWSACYVSGRGSAALPPIVVLAADGIVVAVARSVAVDGGRAFAAVVAEGALEGSSVELRAYGLVDGLLVPLE